MRDDPGVILLVARARNGDQAAWDQIVERYAALVWSTCRRYRLSDADADDVGGMVWLKLVEGLDSLREPAALPGWLAVTTQRTCLKLLEAKQRQVPVDDDGTWGAEEGPSDTWLGVEDRRIALRDAFSELSPRCRQLLSLLFADPPVGYIDIGTKLEIPIGAIGPTRKRCLQRLRQTHAMAAWVDGSEREPLP